MSAGYINMPEATSKVFVDHPFPDDAGHTHLYRTGDLGMFVGSQHFVVLGRIDFQFKIDGNRIQPEEVESVIDKLPMIRKSKVVLLNATGGRPISTCCIAMHESASGGSNISCSTEALISAAERICSEHLPSYMVPHRWLTFQRFPQTAAGKLDTKSVAVEAQDFINSECKKGLPLFGPSIEDVPRGRAAFFLDSALQILSPQHTGSLPLELRRQIQDQSFIASGGSSLSSLQLRSKLRSRGIEISTSQLYSRLSLLEISSKLEASQSRGEETKTKVDEACSSVTEHFSEKISSATQRRLSDYECFMPTTMLQREMVAMGLMDPTLWSFYQFFDMSNIPCSVSQIHEAIGLLVSAKSNMRTVFLLPSNENHPIIIRDMDEAFQFVRSGEIVQAMLKYEFVQLEFSEDNVSESLEHFVKTDMARPWQSDRLLWRAVYLMRPRVLAWRFHHSIIDEWIAASISQDLYRILGAIEERNECRSSSSDSIIASVYAQAKNFSMRSWAIDHYGTGQRDQSPADVISRHTKIWSEFMAGAVSTPIPEELKLSAELLPTVPLIREVEHIPYGKWCRKNHVTPAALFHAMTIARLLQWWRHGGPQSPVEEVTYYRISSNRDSSKDASDIEGALISISPMRVKISATSNPAVIAQSAFDNWLATHESDPYYLDDSPATTVPGSSVKQRRWGNVLLNHIPDRPNSCEKPELCFRSLALDRCGYAKVWPLAALEVTVQEMDSKQANSIRLCVLSTLRSERTLAFMNVFVTILGLILESSHNESAKEIIQRVEESGH